MLDQSAMPESQDKLSVTVDYTNHIQRAQDAALPKVSVMQFDDRRPVSTDQEL
jgi:hypothetical protein